MALEERLDRLEARDRIAELRYEYAYRIDDRDWRGWTDLFTEDATCDYEGWGTIEGREDLLTFAEEVVADAFLFTAHVMHHPVISVHEDGETAAGRWYVEVHDARTDGTARWRIGRYDDQYRRVDGDWKFASVSHEFSARRVYDAVAVEETEYHGDVVTMGTGGHDDPS
jgi:hypothetical protein